MVNKFLGTCTLALVAGTGIAQQNISGFTGNALIQQQQLEMQFDAGLKAVNIDNYIKKLSEVPHHVGSEGNEANVTYMVQQFKKWGFRVDVTSYQVLFPTPKERLLELNSPNKFIAALQEKVLAEDGTSGQTDAQLPTYNCYSADGDVTAPLVYVNYGVPADYEMLARMGVDVKGKIVIARYGKSWRGIKPKVAQEHGAVGCIIYSDPKEDGYYNGDVYPKGAYRPETGAQRGSVEDMPIYPGDPLTPGIAATTNATRLKREAATNLLKIPVLPISYGDALPLLESLDGAVVPEGWRGALPVTYHTGPSRFTVHLKLQFNWDLKEVNNVIAELPGTVFPDQWVIRGNHHDAWVNGAADPVSGLAALMEEARVVGELAKAGQKPKRTIVYCAWDGEEAGLLGSTEWVEDNAELLQNNAVVYINSDGNGRGFVEGGGSASLETLFNEMARDVPDPQTGISVLERKRSSLITSATDLKEKKELLDRKTISLYALGSGSDYSPFFQHLGIPSLNLGFGGEDDGGEYHSIYDSYDLYRRFKDPGFVYGTALSKLAGRATLRMANADLLPFDYRNLSRTIQKYTQEVISLSEQLREKALIEKRVQAENHYQWANQANEPLAAPKVPGAVPFLNFSSLQNQLTQLDLALKTIYDSLPGKSFSAVRKKEFNEKLYRAEQVLLIDEGLPRRSWYRHSIYAPGYYTGYGVKTLPGIREAIEQQNWNEAQEQIEVVARELRGLNNYFEALLAEW